MGLLMKIQFEFEVPNAIEENGVKCYTVQCSIGEFSRIIKARYDESVYTKLQSTIMEHTSSTSDLY